uniref:Uncharacterized protein n=1 Tax=Spironucleus salmonicida TaxID=348837 RepID=V6LTN7_9EUKA|eukprot:EST47950.1 Hypothetical protein SS50377_11933 [Spironucleus salmonicida]
MGLPVVPPQKRYRAQHIVEHQHAQDGHDEARALQRRVPSRHGLVAERGEEYPVCDGLQCIERRAARCRGSVRDFGGSGVEEERENSVQRVHQALRRR